MALKPDILVSVDLGTTFTGVAWMTPRTPPQVISNWPGDGGQNERKVPTVLIYNPDGITVSSWGFICAEDDGVPGKVRRECFKIFLDDATLAAVRQQGLVNTPRSTVEARRFVTDYLGKIYMHVKETVESEMGRRSWKDKTVTFLFSVPTTWESLDIINVFKGCIRDAGFESGGVDHSALVDLTEAEAAAVTTLKTSPIPFECGSLFLTVDAGGGTTDLALMRITSIDGELPQMSQVTAVNGFGVGGTLIDLSFIRLVQQRLAAYPDVHSQLQHDIAVRMSRSPYFVTLKHKFGQRVWMQSSILKVQMEGVSRDFSHAGLGIDKGCMLFSREEIQSLFDVQVQSIIKRIDEQLGWVTQNASGEQVKYMILSGGLGSSVYVRETIQQMFTNNPHPSATEIAVVPCREPQLAVARGLLFSHQQRWENDRMPVIVSHIARASYGVIVQQLYSPAQHFGEDIRDDPYERNKRWAVNQVQWLIKKGDIVYPDTPLIKRFEIRLDEGDITRSWNAEVVTSQNEISVTRNHIADAEPRSRSSEVVRCEEQPQWRAADAASTKI
ncbi:related to hsp70 protein [Fusarium torulosum]|uniref:Related to hsp70 protein n=1 Tax=Fusarium torulosum TaxID=33205 RepID=A0AAE8SMM9_9HYPO|nr:related to hsp70 protein [Fusarium torulosum]